MEREEKGLLETGVGQSILFFIISFILLFSLFLNFLFSLCLLPSLSLSLSLMLSRPPEGFTLEQHENQSLPPSRPPLFHLVMRHFSESVRVCVCGKGISFNLPPLCSPLFFLGGSIPSTLKTNHLVRLRGGDKTKQPQFGLPAMG